MAQQDNPNLKKAKLFRRFPFGWIFAIVIFLLLINSFNVSMTGVPKEIPYSEFYRILKDNPEKIKSVSKIDAVLQGKFTDNTSFFVNIPENDPELLSLMRQNLKHFEVKPVRNFWAAMFFNLGPVLLIILFWWAMASRGEQLGNRLMTFGKVRPKIHSEK
ncbi:MAG: ATP-dependent metallopeptidase FtsH/Yme1/Tma family protein, partial [Candidatus Omnitrophica bacterium]|nr:ATP-dependent metallopeptidase FtsH/Yme1/Tma family protein [Candidatus Omnitrophota bacterium]